jgi:hypothetical protein
VPESRKPSFRWVGMSPQVLVKQTMTPVPAMPMAPDGRVMMPGQAFPQHMPMPTEEGPADMGAQAYPTESDVRAPLPPRALPPWWCPVRTSATATPCRPTACFTTR